MHVTMYICYIRTYTYVDTYERTYDVCAVVLCVCVCVGGGGGGGGGGK